MTMWLYSQRLCYTAPIPFWVHRLGSGWCCRYLSWIVSLTSIDRVHMPNACPLPAKTTAETF
ncbi:hypothetical protein DAI22_05g220500 [Oryza sativa Japonica Group]|nr:hypothetical protein DAI22_05g220500 [Oryza sativa Japonica Group]